MAARAAKKVGAAANRAKSTGSRDARKSTSRPKLIDMESAIKRGKKAGAAAGGAGTRRWTEQELLRALHQRVVGLI